MKKKPAFKILPFILCVLLLSGVAFLGDDLSEGQPSYIGTTVIKFLGRSGDIVFEHTMDSKDYVQAVLDDILLRDGLSKKKTTFCDIDHLSGATFTTRAVLNAAESEHFGKECDFGFDWTLIIPYLLLFTLGVYLMMGKRQGVVKDLIAALTMGLSFIWFGVVSNQAMSLSSLLGVIFSSWEWISFNIFLSVVVFSNIAFILVTGRNLYCTFLCPYMYAQKSLSMVINQNYRLSTRVEGALKRVMDLALFVFVLVALAKSDPSHGSWEVFHMFFDQYGSTVRLLAFWVFIIGSLSVNMFWCKGFCLLGRALHWLVALRKSILH
ncbi:FMN-binding protein [Vibrio crassostreae]|uniref:FMN-binding protein n=1 Tax=Vibrio crassostreae TaxID=246167 RepID=UPI001B301FB4|nr:hypothetical protein [Vibrio crassostreae]